MPLGAIGSTLGFGPGGCRFETYRGIHTPEAKLEKHLTTNEKIVGSSPIWSSKMKCQKKCKLNDQGTACEGCGRTLEEIKAAYVVAERKQVSG